MDYTLKDYENEIEIRKKMIKLAKRRREELVLNLGPKGYGTGRSYVDADTIRGNKSMDYPDLIEAISQIDNKIYLHERVIEYNKNMISEIKDCINDLTGLKCKIKNMQIVQGKTLKEIANEIGYSYDYTREVAVKK